MARTMKKRVLQSLKKDWKTWTFLILIIGLAAALRFTGIDWDRGAHLHPDERFLSMVTTDIKWPGNVTSYFDTKTSPLNPANTGKTFFVYGTFPVFLTKLVADILGMGHYVGYPLVGRALSGLFDILTLIVVFLIAKELFDTRTGLLSAFLLALAVIHIQHAHFYVVDLFATFFLVLTFYFVLLFLKTRHFMYAVLSGAAMGFGLASKINVILLAPIIGLVFIRVFAIELKTLLRRKQTPRKAIATSLKHVLLYGILLFAVAFVIFRILQPYAFEGPHLWNVRLSKTFVDSFENLSRLTSKESATGYVPSFQWVDRPFYFQLKNLTLWGLGIPLGILCWLGLLYSSYLIIFKKQYKLFLITAWLVSILIYQSLQFVKTLRYLLPITPFLIILGAFLVISAYDKTRKVLRKNHQLVVFAIFTIIALGCLFWSAAFTNIYLNTHPRIAASEWIYENVPENTTIATEPWDDGIPFYLDGMPLRRTYNETRLEIFGQDDNEKIKKLSGQLSNVTYVFITSNRNYKVLPRMPGLPLIARYYELLFNGELGFVLEKESTNYPQLFGIEINDDNSEEAFTVYDHPKVLIFKNEQELTSEELFKRITST